MADAGNNSHDDAANEKERWLLAVVVNLFEFFVQTSAHKYGLQGMP
jgi:hypothetical protein